MNAAVLEAPLSEAVSHPPDAEQRAPGAWMQVLSHLDPKYGGLAAVVPALAATLQQRAGTTVQLAAFCAPGENTEGAQNAEVDTSIWPAEHRRWLLDADLRRRFADMIRAMDGVHIHGLWDASNLVAARATRKQNKPYIVSAHGMLEPWALAQKAVKKRLYGTFVERPTLQGAAWLHALTNAEADDYRRFGCTGPIAVIPNAVEAPAVIDPNLIERMFPQIKGKRVVLFLGRLHVKKGIELLLQAWTALHKEHPDTLLMLAGTGDESFVRALQAHATEVGIAEDVIFAGMLDNAAKWSALRRAHVFVLPSHSEGLSVAVLEALCAGVPVVLTEACHLPEIESGNCGWQVQTNAAQVEAAVRESLESSNAEQLTRSRNARRLAAARFSWDTVSQQMAELYACVLGGGTPELSQYREALQ